MWEGMHRANKTINAKVGLDMQSMPQHAKLQQTMLGLHARFIRKRVVIHGNTVSY